MEEETQFVPFVIHVAQSDAAWLAAWAPDPRALGAHAMGLAALRGLLAEDMPKDGQPLGGEIQHARALIENANALAKSIHGTGSRVVRNIDTEPIVRFDLGDSEPVYPARIRAIERDAKDAAALLDNLRQRISGVENRCALLENDAESAAGRIAALEESREASISVAGDHSRKLIGLLERVKEVEERNAGPRLASLEARLAEMGNRIAGHDTLIRVVETAQDIQRNRIAALEAKS